MANLYYREGLSAAEFVSGSEIDITGDEARHAVRVSRLRQGEQILIGNGEGALANAEAIAVGKDRFTVRLLDVRQVDVPAVRLTLMQALAKGDRDERAVEQSTEFGVDGFSPWQAARSVSRWDGVGGAEKSAKGIAKWQRIAREASKQSLRAWVPVVGPLTTTREICAAASDPEVEVVVLHPRGTRALSAWVTEGLAAHVREIKLVVGPEGGLADAEIDELEAAGARVLVLGSTVLRTSSAGPAALAVLNVGLARW